LEKIILDFFSDEVTIMKYGACLVSREGITKFNQSVYRRFDS